MPCSLFVLVRCGFELSRSRVRFYEILRGGKGKKEMTVCK